jgi:hypothetical protein
MGVVIYFEENEVKIQTALLSLLNERLNREKALLYVEREWVSMDATSHFDIDDAEPLGLYNAETITNETNAEFTLIRPRWVEPLPLDLETPSGMAELTIPVSIRDITGGLIEAWLSYLDERYIIPAQRFARDIRRLFGEIGP